ncbi:MAG TPA: hypothetical protein VNG51_28910, partial [Ktedonobacteraceae bacterium]|nr:hypothetical protein [Ktedonobacteraceae bacterium]
CGKAQPYIQEVSLYGSAFTVIQIGFSALFIRAFFLFKWYCTLVVAIFPGLARTLANLATQYYFSMDGTLNLVTVIHKRCEQRMGGGQTEKLPDRYR